jgi:hypothetical protein
MRLIGKVLEFANSEITSQEQVHGIFRDLPQVLRGKLGAAVLTLTPELIERFLAEPETLRRQLAEVRDAMTADAESRDRLMKLPEDVGVRPYFADRWALRGALRDIAGRNPAKLSPVKNKIAATLRRVLRPGTFSVAFEGGRLRVAGEQFLDGVEAVIWWGLALIFEHGLDPLVRVCHAKLDGEECGNIFLYTPKLRKFCSPEHAKLALPQTIRKWYDVQRKKQGLEPFRWGTRPRKKEKGVEKGQAAKKRAQRGRKNGRGK